jgi:mycothiol synthase
VTAEPITHLTPGQVSAVLDLAAAAADADGIAPLSEHGMLRVQHSTPGQGDDFIVTAADGTVTGYAYLDPRSPDDQERAGELVVHPASRRNGLGTALAQALVAAAGQQPVRVWAHGDLPAAAALASAAGFERFRALWQLRRSLADPLPDPGFGPDVLLRTFRPGKDEEPWLRVNGRAFAKHPEQGGWTSRDLELREREPWFDPDGFFIAEDTRSGAMLGFHWTKVHPDDVGEVYVVGIDPDAQGRGLGRSLTLAGLHYLRQRGLGDVMLYADEDNTAAIGMYRKLGFTPWRTDAMYRRPAETSSGR